MTTFEDLDDDVLYLILEYLYLERSAVLRTLRGSSRRLKDFADAVAHRTLSLIDDEAHKQITYRLAERLKDHVDQLRYYVRSLRIVNFKGDADSYCLNSALIVKCITRIQRLETFSWDCNQPMSTQILDVLQQQFFKAQVCANIALTSQVLLNIPQLHRLDVSVPCLDYFHDQRVSLFNDLKQALLRLSSLRHLSIDTYTDDKIFRLQGVSLNRLQIPLESGDRLPSLVTLELRSTSYDFDADHCQHLLESIDCNKLEQLTIASFNPISFFDTFSGYLPSLTYLDISYVSDIRNDPRHNRLRACSGFLTSLKSLQSLVFRFDNLDFRSDFASVQQNVHGPHLLHLSLLARPANSTGPELSGNIRKYLWKFANLKSLKMEFPSIRSYHRCLHCEGCNGEDHFQFSFIPPLPSLTEVNLSVRVHSSEQPLITTINKHAHCAIRHLWTTFASKPNSQLETLSLRFWRWETGRTTELKETIYDTMRLRGRLTIRVRHNRKIPVTVYNEICKEQEDGLVLVRFDELDQREGTVEL